MKTGIMVQGGPPKEVISDVGEMYVKVIAACGVNNLEQETIRHVMDSLHKVCGVHGLTINGATVISKDRK